TCFRKESSLVCSTQWSRRPRNSKTGINPIPFAKRMNRKNVMMRGVHVFTHLLPTLGRTIVSRVNSTPYSRAFIRPEGTCRSRLKSRRTVMVPTRNTTAATSQSISTCLVTERLTPRMVGSWISGWPMSLFETCSMMTLPALNFSAASDACPWSSSTCGCSITLPLRIDYPLRRFGNSWTGSRPSTHEQPAQQERFGQIQSDEIPDEAGDERRGPRRQQRHRRRDVQPEE